MVELSPFFVFCKNTAAPGRSSLFFHPSSLILLPSSLIIHSSSLILHPSSLSDIPADERLDAGDVLLAVVSVALRML
jgi:hypothetical protein